MAIYSLHHAPIGRSTQARPHTTSAHVSYITRRQAMSRYEAARMPDGPRKAAAYLRRMEDCDRANARVADKVRLALPRELNEKQRADLVRDFAEEVTQGRAPWLAAFHDRGKDAHNPHCHLLIRDRDPDTGRRVIGMSEGGSTEKLREAWERHANQALANAGRPERIDRRTLQDQGIARTPTIHEGPRSQEMVKRGARPASRPINRRNQPGARSRSRVVDYPAIDAGRSRPAYNAAVRSAGRESEADLWAAIDADQQRGEFEARGYGADSQRHSSVQHISGRPHGSLPESLRRPGAEGCSASLIDGPCSLEPPTYRVRERRDEPSEADQKEIEYLVRNPISRCDHNPIIGELVLPGKRHIMNDEEEARRRNLQALGHAQHSADQSRAMYDNSMEKSYLDPTKAERKMDAYRAKHGNEALYKKLEGNPRKTEFGRRPGSILSTEGYAPGASARREQSQIARQGLPELARNHHRNEERLQGAARAASVEAQDRAARKEQLMQQMRDQEQARKLDKTRTRSR